MIGAGERSKPGMLAGLKFLPCLAVLAAGGLGAAEADPALAGILQGITAERLFAEVDHLVSFGSRRWDQAGGKDAQEWIRSRLAALPLDDVFVQDFDDGSDNVIGVLRGAERPERAHVIGAHYDSWNSAGPAAPAPGADDNASGTAAVLEAARVLSASGLRPAETVVFALFSGEEPGLLGSRHFVAAAGALPWGIADMVCVDVIGYVKPGTVPDLSVSSSVVFGPIEDLIGSLKETASIYLPDWPFEGGPGCG